MAEQISHNVVNKPESTSGSPLVDVTANNSNTDSAARGTQHQPTTESASYNLDPLKSTNESAIYANATVSKAHDGLDAAKNAAEPSAGDAVHLAIHDASNGPGALSADNGQGGLITGMRDDASQGEGPADDRSTADFSVDVSTNSDTDNSRVDAAEKKDGSHHVRTNSVKKPTTFSKVTATKNFMNKIAPSAPATPKVGEKREYKLLYHVIAAS